MNRLIAVLGIVIILLGAVCGVVYYQISDMQRQNNDLQNHIGQLENQVSELELQNRELQNQTRELENKLDKVSNASLVRITELTVRHWTSSGFELHNFSLTVQNFGINDAEGLNLSVVDASFNYSIDNVQLELLKAGEAKVVEIREYHSFPGWDPHFVATLVLDDIILDEHSVISQG